ncbi:MAG: hypothetical protein GY801_43050 [bacterium]|nr:hypothetical protein [bacterium]
MIVEEQLFTERLGFVGVENPLDQQFDIQIFFYRLSDINFTLSSYPELVPTLCVGNERISSFRVT